MKRFFLHIGAGKVGSSSVQGYLQHYLNENRSKGVLYCGMTFNSLGNDLEWKSNPWLLKSAPTEKMVCQQLIREVEKYNSNAGDEVQTFVLSNESLSLQLEPLMPFIRYLRDSFDLKIVFYTRSPEKWVQSAYTQWAIKDKLNEGDIFSFSEYVSQKPYSQLKRPLEILVKHGYKDNIIVRNAEKLPENDVVEDFCELLGISYLGFARANETLNDIEKAIFYHVNSNFAGSSKPDTGEALITKVRELGKQSRFYDDVKCSQEMFDESSILETKKFLNKFLVEEQRYSHDFSRPSTGENKLSPMILGLIELASIAFCKELRDANVK